MTRRLTGRGFVALACLAGFAGTSCSPADPTSPPPPVSPSASPPATPTETAQEREQRLAYEAAEKSYREFRAEFNRLLASGGAKEATPGMKATAGASYLKDNLEVVQAYRGLGYHQVGTDRIVYIRRGGYSPSSVVLATCEDATDATTFSKKGKAIGRGDVRALQLEARKTASGWKVWSGSGKNVGSCDI